MPFSWVRVSCHTSRKLRDCVGEDGSRVRAAQCIDAITKAAGGNVDQSWFELNGKYAHVLIEWTTSQQKARIVFDLEADQVVDLFAADEIDELAAERFSAD